MESKPQSGRESLDSSNVKDASLTSVQSEPTVRRSFTMMCFCFGLNHATQTTAIAYASTSLDTDIGSASNAVLYGVCMFSSLFLGPLCVGLLGTKNAMLFSMSTYVVYVFCFGAAVFFPSDSMGRWSFALGGASIGGIGAGMLWTSQGAFFTAVADNLCESGSASRMTVTSQLSSLFAIWFLGMECGLKVLLAVLQQYAGLSSGAGFVFFGAIAAAATVAFSCVGEVRGTTLPPSSSCGGKAVEALRLWPDPKIWLISGSNFAFGFAAAWVNGYVNAIWLKQALDMPTFVGYLSALVCLVAALSAKVYGYICDRLGSKLPVASFGSFCLFAISALSLVLLGLGPEAARGWGWGVTVFYILLGLGRGVYESTNKGIFADFYPGEKGTGAFANVSVQNTAASAAGFAFNALGVNQPIVYLLMASSALMMPGLVAAYMLQRRSERAGADVRTPSTSFLGLRRSSSQL